MANDVYGILYQNVHPVSGDTDEEAVDEETFLREVITPFYRVLRLVLSSSYSTDCFWSLFSPLFCILVLS